jgi:hypothetical protein
MNRPPAKVFLGKHGHLALDPKAENGIKISQHCGILEKLIGNATVFL